MMRATEQATQLRQRLCAQSDGTSAIPGDVRRALSLILLDGVSDPGRVYSYATQDLTFCAVDPERLVLVPDLPSPDTRSAVTGLATLAFSHREADISSVSRDEFDERLAACLPPPFESADSAGILERLCSLAAVDGRVRQSGLLRMLGGGRPTTDASPAQQAAFLHHGFLTDPDDSNNTAPLSIELIPDPQPVSQDAHAARGVHRALLQAIKPLSSSPGTANARVSLRAIEKSIRALPVAGGDLGATLREYALDLVVNGTPNRSAPAASSIYTYLSVIGPGLVDRLSGQRFADLASEDFSDAYCRICDSKRSVADQKRAASQLIHIHTIATRLFGLEPLDTSALRSYLGGDVSPVPGDFVLPAEYAGALAWLRDQWRDETPAADAIRHALWRRECQLTTVALILLRRTGARISEIVLLRHSDVLIFDQCIFLLIRPSKFRTNKTGAGRRRISLKSDVLSADEFDVVTRWVSCERQRLAINQTSSAPLFTNLGTPRRPMRPDRVRHIFKLAFGTVSNRELWPHLLRHTWYNDQWQDISAFSARLTNDPLRCSRLARRVACITASMGHSSSRTGVAHYLHLSWLVNPHNVEQDLAASSRGALAFASGRKISTVDKIRQRRGVNRRGWASAVFNATFEVEKARTAPALFAPSLPIPYTPVHPAALNHLLELSRSRSEALQLAPQLGLSSDAMDEILITCKKLASQCGVVIATYADERRRVPVTRRIAGFSVDGLLSPALLDSADGAILTDFLVRYHRVRTADELRGIRCEASAGHAFVEALLRTGMSPEHVRMDSDAQPDWAIVSFPIGGIHGLRLVRRFIGLQWVLRSVLTSPSAKTREPPPFLSDGP